MSLYPGINLELGGSLDLLLLKDDHPDWLCMTITQNTSSANSLLLPKGADVPRTAKVTCTLSSVVALSVVCRRHASVSRLLGPTVVCCALRIGILCFRVALWLWGDRARLQHAWWQYVNRPDFHWGSLCSGIRRSKCWIQLALGVTIHSHDRMLKQVQALPHLWCKVRGVAYMSHVACFQPHRSGCSRC